MPLLSSGIPPSAQPRCKPALSVPSSCPYLRLLLAPSPFSPQQSGQGRHNAPATLQLLLRFFVDAVYKLQVMLHHPFRRPLHVRSAVELKGSPHRYHHPPFQVRFQQTHKDLLLRCSQGHPYDVRPVLLDGACYLRVVKVLHLSEGQLYELHPLHLRVHFRQSVVQPVQCLLRSPHENHAILPSRHDVPEDLASAVLFIPLSIDPLQVQRHVAAVADGEHSPVHHLQVFRVPVCVVQNHSVRHSDVVRLSFLHLPVDAFPHRLAVKFISDVEICLHIVIILLDFLSLQRMVYICLKI